jgi:KAP family P-loop domain
MRIITPPLVVEEIDSFKNDVLDRKAYGEALLNLVDRSNDELVISLDGKWGEGKTTFVKMWQGLLSEANIPNLYIDAFANDYVDDAFVSVASAITSYAEANIGSKNDYTLLELKDKAKQVGGQLLSWTARIGIKAATLGVLKDSDIDELKDIKDDLSKGVSGVIGDFIEERLTSHAKEVAQIQSFRELLSKLPSQLKINIENTNKKPLVIIIDELDRCKPTFAVELLEKIKHLFSVKNIVFVLVMHKQQLEESVKCVYGQNIDAHTYLQKFINLEMKIPKRNETHDNDLSKYCRKLVELHELENWINYDVINGCIIPLVTFFDLSLRQLEKVYTNLALFYGSITENHIKIEQIIVFLSVVKVIKPQIFQKLLIKKISFQEVSEEFIFSDFSGKPEHVRSLSWIRNWLGYCLLEDQNYISLPEENEIKLIGRSSHMLEFGISRHEIIPMFAKRLSLFVVN